MKNILIIGYPKSGTTWLSRLIGELLQAPVKGYWNASHHEPASEGLDRVSPYCCYKSHISYENLQKQEGIYKCIYIYRDPRDIALSGAHFFKPRTHKLFKLPVLSWLYKIYENLIVLPQMKWKMSQDLVYGNARFAKALGLKWSKHLRPYLADESIYSISYEDLHKDTSTVLKKLAGFLEVQIGDEMFEYAIQRQSIDRLKGLANTRKDKIVREGKIGSWKSELPVKAKALLNDELKDELVLLGYSMD